MRLIDADELIHFYFDDEDGNETFGFVPDEFIEEAPVIEAEPIVRCKDCIVQKTCCFAQYLGNEGYCSKGERGDEVEE